MKNKINYIILHHSATARDTTTFESIKNNHINKKKLSDIAYNYLIEGDGEYNAGRREGICGAHCRARINGISMNYQSIGICLTGDFREEKPSKEQLQTLRMLLKDIRNRYDIPVENILGHKETGSSTVCPADLMKWIINYRRIEKLKKQINILSKMIKIYKKLLLLLKKRK